MENVLYSALVLSVYTVHARKISEWIKNTDELRICFFSLTVL
jgi:hypothetical protein